MSKKKTRRIRFDGFTPNLFFDEDGDWLACLLELPSVSAFAETPEQALEELHTAWEGVKESCMKHNDPIPIAPAQKEYSGRFNVRIDRRIHKALAMEAAQAGISLNALVSQKLAKSTRFD